MYKHCRKCNRDFDCTFKKCPTCAERLETKYTEEELAKIKKENEDLMIINTLIM